MTAPANVTFRIRRYDPASQQPPTWEDVTIPYTHGMTVLDGLRVIKETRSATSPGARRAGWAYAGHAACSSTGTRASPATRR